jgi:deoxyxylulose-5-phosphate synthase
MDLKIMYLYPLIVQLIWPILKILMILQASAISGRRIALLAQELRDFIIEAVATKEGHLGPV